MANDYRQIWYFSSGATNNTTSWSEVYYRQASSLQDAATFEGTGVITARLALLNTTFLLRKVRVSQVGAPRVSTVVQCNNQGTNSDTTGGEIAYPNPNGVAAYITLSSNVGIGATRKVALRGTTTNSFYKGNAGTNLVSAAATVLLNNWFTQLQKANYEILKLSPISNFPGYPYLVSEVAPGTQAGTSIVTLSGPVNPVTTPRVILSRCSKKDAPGLNGQWAVLAASGNTITINYVTPGYTTLTNVNGRLRPQQYTSGLVITPSLCGFSYLQSRQTRDFFNNVAAARRINRGLRISP